MRVCGLGWCYNVEKKLIVIYCLLTCFVFLLQKMALRRPIKWHNLSSYKGNLDLG